MAWILGCLCLGCMSVDIVRAILHLHEEKPKHSIANISTPFEQHPESGRFVQENGPRSSFRPDFSPNNLRNSFQRNNFVVLRAFRESLGEAWKSTVRLLDGEQQVALGAVVHPDGWVITKASQLPIQGDIICQLFDGTDTVAQLVNERLDLDLALLRVSEHNLPAVTWEIGFVPVRGSWLATTDANAIPTSVGVVSTGTQRVPRSQPVLGVLLEPSAAGAAVKEVIENSGAKQAGLQQGDNIYSIDGQKVRSRNDLVRVIKDRFGGEVVTLGVDRAETLFDIKARLMDLPPELLEASELEVNGPVSRRSTGFDHVFLHDTVLKPSDCGGPVVNLNGQVVGLNIARAGRVASYALPASIIKPLVEQLIEEAKLVSKRFPENQSSEIR